MTIRFFILSLVIMVCSCTEPFDIGSFEGEDKLAVFSALTPDSLVFLSLAKTRSITSRGSSIYEANAEIEIINQNGEITPLYYRSPSESGKLNGGYIAVDFKPEIGKEYSLSVKVDGFEDLLSSCVIPVAAPFGDIILDSVQFKDIPNLEPNKKKKQITIIGSFSIDLPENDNRQYYHLASADISLDWVTEGQHGDLNVDYNYTQLRGLPIENRELDNPAYVSLVQEPGFLIDDRFINDGNTSIPFRLSFITDWRTQDRFNHLILNLRRCDRAYFEFHRSVARQLETKDSPFSEPVVIATNIENGIGYFSGYSTGQAVYSFPPN